MVGARIKAYLTENGIKQTFLAAQTVNIQDHLEDIAEKLSTTPVTTLMEELIDKAISFGLKLLGALAIYLIGAWLIRKIKSISFR